MQPIQELLNRILWDKEFSNNDFSIGYYDRLENKMIHVPFQSLYFDEEDHFSFQIVDENGETHNIPFHRVKELYKNGELIWSRQH